MYIYIYIYIYRERERDINNSVPTGGFLMKALVVCMLLDNT